MEPRTTGEDGLIPSRTRIPWRLLPPWLAAAAILFVLFVIVGLYSERVDDVLNLRMPYWEILRNGYSAAVANLLLFGVPSPAVAPSGSQPPIDAPGMMPRTFESRK